MKPGPVILLTIGVLLFLISLTADTLGIGIGIGFGWKQVTGALTGVVLAAIGMIWLKREKRGR